MHTITSNTIFIILFSLSTTCIFSQENKPRKHYMGINFGIDPFNILKLSVKTALDNDDEYDSSYDDGEKNFGILTLGAYYKYKPFKKIDFDIGYKLNLSSLEDLSSSTSQYESNYWSGADHLFYIRPNYNFKNIHEEGEGHISTAVELGYMYTPAKREVISHNHSGVVESTKIRGRNFFYEFKVGYKYGVNERSHSSKYWY